MKIKKAVLIVCTAMALLAAAGCGKKADTDTAAAPEPTATPVPTVTPTPAPTATPAPTVTPAPRALGIKGTDSKSIYLTNSTDHTVRQLYIKTSNADDWGRNLIPSESSVKVAEQVQLYYTPSSDESVTTYDVRVVNDTTQEYVIYSVELGDMEKANLEYSEENGIYLRYMSLSRRKETSTADSSVSYSDTEDYDYESDYSESTDDGYYDENYWDYESENDDSWDYESENDDSWDYEDNNYDYEDDSGDSDYSDENGYEDDGGGVVWDEDGNWTEG